MDSTFKKPNFKSRPGSKSPTSKLTEKEVLAMRKDLEEGMLVADAALKYKISKAVVYQIRVRKSWAHI